jgi:hypothetical protein
MNKLRKEQLKEKLDKLEPEEHAQIFDVVKRYTSEFTRTQNGVLISSEHLSDECLIEIEKMVFYFIDQRKRMDIETAERNALSRT